MRKCPKVDPQDHDFECPFFEEDKPCIIKNYKKCILFRLDYIIANTLDRIGMIIE